MTRSKIAWIVAGTYVTIGLAYQQLGAMLVPATNIFGRGYLLVMWPLMLAHLHPPIPHWCFGWPPW